MSANTQTPTAVTSNKDNAQAQDAKPIGNLKKTVHIEPSEAEKKKAELLRQQFEVDDNLLEIQRLTKLSKQYNNIDFKLDELRKFEYKEGDEDETYGASTITITDSKRKEFKIQNPRLVETLVKDLIGILTDKKAELSGQLRNVKISK